MTTHFALTDAPIDIKSLEASLMHPGAGAFVAFEGRVRDNNDGRTVARLEYEIFRTLALAEGERILSEATQQFGLLGATAVHREGVIELGACAVYIGVVAPHRAEAFAACRMIIDAIKHRLPVWKKEHYISGAHAWVNCQHHDAEDVAVDGRPSTSLADVNEAYEERDYYARQMPLPEIGESGQARLRRARVLVVGAGGLGSSASLALAAAGVGVLCVADFDRVAVSNLHRQILYTTEDLGQLKAARAAKRLRAMNPFIQVESFESRVTTSNVTELLSGFDMVLDCSDNFATKYLLNDAAVLSAKPLFQASLYRHEGQLLLIDPLSNGGCLRCLWPEPPDTGAVGDCEEVGVLGALPMTFGTLLGLEAIKRILGKSPSLARQLYLQDVMTLETRKVERRRRPDCALCGDHPVITTVEEGEIRNLSLENRHDVQPLEWSASSETIEQLTASFKLVDVREENERSLSPLEGALLLPFSTFNPEALKLPFATPLLIFCSQGNRSRTAVQKLRAAGFSSAYSLRGGAARFLGPKGAQAAHRSCAHD